jgi:AraC family L-rhamnose operon transcriptional activator RhaR
VFGDKPVPITASCHLLHGDHAIHEHEFFEIATIVDGCGLHHSIHGSEALQRGDTFVCPPATWHAYRDCRRLAVYTCCFGAELFHRELAWVCEDPALSYIVWTGPFSMNRRGILKLHLSEGALQGCEQQLDHLSGLGSERSARTKADQVGHLLLLLGELARSVDQRAPASQGKLDATHPAVMRGIRLLESRFEHTWTLAELAGALHLNGSYLVRLFKAETGLSPMAYLTRHRLEQAAVLLLNTDRQIAEIGAVVGWADPNYFARCFKAHFGFSASVYRRTFTTNPHGGHTSF